MLSSSVVVFTNLLKTNSRRIEKYHENKMGKLSKSTKRMFHNIMGMKELVPKFNDQHSIFLLSLLYVISFGKKMKKIARKTLVWFYLSHMRHSG